MFTIIFTLFLSYTLRSVFELLSKTANKQSNFLFPIPTMTSVSLTKHLAHSPLKGSTGFRLYYMHKPIVSEFHNSVLALVSLFLGDVSVTF